MISTYHSKGQVSLVTGASSGMGLATAKAFAEAGATVVLADINEAAGLWIRSPGASFELGVALPVDGGFVAH